MSNFNQIEHLRSEFRTRDRSNFDLIQQLATEEGRIQEKKEILNEYLGNREKYAQKLSGVISSNRIGAWPEL